MKSDMDTNLGADQLKFLIWLIGLQWLIQLIENINHQLFINFRSKWIKFFNVYEYVSC